MGRNTWGRRVRRVFTLFAGCALVFLYYVDVWGLPERCASRLLASWNKGDIVVRVNRLKFDLRGSIRGTGVRLYVKGVTGSPALEANRVELRLDLPAYLHGGEVLDTLCIEEGVIRPDMAITPPERRRAGWAGRPTACRVDLKRVEVQGVWIEAMSGMLRIDEQTLRMEKLEGVVGHPSRQQGAVTGEFNYYWHSSAFCGHAVSRFDPNFVVPLLRSWNFNSNADIVETFQFRRKGPFCDFIFSGRANEPYILRIKGRVETAGCMYCGVDTRSATGDVEMSFSSTNSCVKLSRLHVVRNEGEVNGDILLNFTDGTVACDAVSTADPRAVAEAIGPAIESFVNRFRFDGPALVKMKGLVGYHDIASSDMVLSVDARKMGVASLKADTCAFVLHLLGNTMILTNFCGTAYGGAFSGGAIFSFGSTNTQYRVCGEVSDIDLHELMSELAGAQAERYEGRLNADIDVGGLAGKGLGKTATGHGRVSIKHGRIFRIPVFGGLSDTLSRFVPGLDFILRQTDARSSFDIGDGKLHTKEVRVEGDILSLSGKGDYYLDGTLDFRVMVTLMKKHEFVAKILRFLTSPVSKLFEFHLTGIVNAPVWRSINLRAKTPKKKESEK